METHRVMMYRLQISMECLIVLVFPVMFQPALSVLFTVEAEQAAYKSLLGEKVEMGCRFSHQPSQRHNNLKVTWQLIQSGPSVDVVRLDNGVEHADSPKFNGRVKILTEELNDGVARLQISNLTIDDSGTYQCLVNTDDGGDYKTLTLSVSAPYKTVIKSVEKAAEADRVVITCQSEGHPKSAVSWSDGHSQTLDANTTTTSTPERLFRISSSVQVSSSEENNYTCTFTRDGAFATFRIPDELAVPHVKSDALLVVLSVGILMLVVVVGLLVYRRKNGFSSLSTRNLMAESREPSSCNAAAPQAEREHEKENETTSLREVSVSA
ncbi:unnamed protein product [Ophioblennius macclurei]